MMRFGWELGNWGAVPIFGLVKAVLGWNRNWLLETGANIGWSIFTLFTFHGSLLFIYLFFTSLVFSAHCIVFSGALENILPPLFFSFMSSPQLYAAPTHELGILSLHSSWALCMGNPPFYVHFSSAKCHSGLSCSKRHHQIFLDTCDECHPSL